MMVAGVDLIDGAKVYRAKTMTLTPNGYVEAISILLQLPDSESLLCLTDGAGECEHAMAVYRVFGDGRTLSLPGQRKKVK